MSPYATSFSSLHTMPTHFFPRHGRFSLFFQISFSPFKFFSDSSLVSRRLTRHQSLFWRNLFPLRPRGFYAVFSLASVFATKAKIGTRGNSINKSSSRSNLYNPLFSFSMTESLFNQSIRHLISSTLFFLQVKAYQSFFLLALTAFESKPLFSTLSAFHFQG